MSKKILTLALVVNALALIALLAYSLERTAWLFQRFEVDQMLPIAAAVVVEVAAIGLLIGAGAIAQLDSAARAWANRALVAVLSVQALANLSAGYLRGGRATLALFAGSNDNATYAVAATLWFAVNLAVPGLILCLSKLMERLLFAQQNSADLPLREQVRELRESLAKKEQLLASATVDLAIARESETGLRERLADVEHAAANEASGAAEARERAANQERQLASYERTVEKLRGDLAEAREQVMTFGDTPPTQARIVSYVREQQAEGRALLEISRELGISESTLRGWTKPATNGHLIEEPS